MDRIGASTATVKSALAAQQLSNSLEDRVANVVQIYDSHGNHRTASEGDTASAHWLSDEVRRVNVEPTRESFSLDRVDPQACYVRVAGQRIDGVPLFDAGSTGVEGITGRLGPLGSDADIGLTESEPSRLTDPGSESRRAFLSEIRQSRHKAVVLLTRGTRAGLFLLNAPAFKKPWGPPTLQVSSTETQPLTEHAKAGVQATLVAHVERTAAQAFNVTAKVSGADSNLSPLVISTPRSGWWQCASERGGGLACWLEAMRSLTATKPVRDCLFVAFSGHEISWLGIDDYLKRRPDLVKRARAWIHFGANVGAPRKPNMINASEDALEHWAAAAMEAEGLTVNRKATRGSTPFGEAAIVHRGGGRYVALVCDSEVFHHASDRWPEAVDVTALARYVRAYSNGIVKLATQTG
jgi:hypothetical protein